MSYSKPYAYIDVDLTLVDIDLNLLPGVLEKLPKLKLKYKLVAWSAGGDEYAAYVLSRTGIAKYFDLVLDKPYVIIDDEPDSILSRASVVRVSSKDAWDKIFSGIFHKDVGC